MSFGNSSKEFKIFKRVFGLIKQKFMAIRCKKTIERLKVSLELIALLVTLSSPSHSLTIAKKRFRVLPESGNTIH